MKVRPNTTTRPDAFRETACYGSDPGGHANSRVGSHFPNGDPSSREKALDRLSHVGVRGALRARRTA
jgi:hypothetical protein